MSICCITFNHEKYIAQALEGFLIQRTSFPFEIIVGEDCSADKTRDIVLNYQKKYPNLIRIVASDENVGNPYNGIRTRAAARGKYIALCEGDDYWTDPQKLQKQVEFLDRNPEYTICFHNVKVIYEENNVQPHLFYVENPNQSFMQGKPNGTSDIIDIVKGNYIQTPSVMFRAGSFGEFPAWYYKLDRGDWPLHILNAQQGKIRYMDEVLAVYRVHSSGIYSSIDRLDQLIGAISTSIAIDKHLKYMYHEEIWESNTQRICQSIRLMMERDGFTETLKFTLFHLTKYRAISNHTIMIIVKFIKVSFSMCTGFFWRS